MNIAEGSPTPFIPEFDSKFGKLLNSQYKLMIEMVCSP